MSNADEPTPSSSSPSSSSPADTSAVEPIAFDAGETPLPESEQPDSESIQLDPDDLAAEPPPTSVFDPAALEALLFSTHHPLTAGRLAELLSLESTKPVRQAIAALNDGYTATGRSFRIEQVAGGYQMLTLPQFGDLIQRLVQKDIDAKLGKAAMETLAIIAYKQPILRVDVEGIRGVACGETIRNLMEKHLVKIAGRAEEPGRPILYGTTKRFLEVFGLNSLSDLPAPEKASTGEGQPRFSIVAPPPAEPSTADAPDAQ